jgi:uncharacterized protein YbjQ (UPF0145 family)
MKKAIRVLLTVFAFMSGGCIETSEPGVKLEQDSVMRLRKEVRIFDTSELQNKEYRRLGQIEATSCMRMAWDSPPSKEDAMDELRYKASALGGNGITNIICKQCNEPDFVIKNCWASITCYGVAITLEPAGEELPKLSQETTKLSGSEAVPIDHEFVYDEKTKKGYISVKGRGLEARPWMIKQIEAVCSSKDVIIQGGTEPEPAYYRILNEKLQNGKFTIEFELVR